MSNRTLFSNLSEAQIIAYEQLGIISGFAIFLPTETAEEIGYKPIVYRLSEYEAKWSEYQDNCIDEYFTVFVHDVVEVSFGEIVEIDGYVYASIPEEKYQSWKDANDIGVRPDICACDLGAFVPVDARRLFVYPKEFDAWVSTHGNWDIVCEYNEREKHQDGREHLGTFPTYGQAQAAIDEYRNERPALL